jgi:ribosomal protein S18 acetylase RimI-like enzyme
VISTSSETGLANLQLWINEIGVAPSYERKSIAKTMLNALLSRGQELGAPTLGF